MEYVDVGFGNTYRKLSQYPLMRAWEKKRQFANALQSPYDPYINDDAEIFECDLTFSRTLEKVASKSYDLVFNFGFIQRFPRLIDEMKRVAKRYVAAFAPNRYNFGHGFIHPFFHRVRGTKCQHIDRGEPTLMMLDGLINLFERSGLTVLEKGYVDIPIWLDTVVHVSEIFGSRKPMPLRMPMPRQLVYLENLWPTWFKRVQAHHIYAFAGLD